MQLHQLISFYEFLIKNVEHQLNTHTYNKGETEEFLLTRFACYKVFLSQLQQLPKP